MVDTKGGKKRKRNVVDRISLLPDSLIHQILSSLPTREVVQTCVLSKRWKTVWTHMHTIDFDFTNHYLQYTNSRRYSPSVDTLFNHFVFGVLSQLCGTTLQKLSYSTPRARNDKDSLEFLIFYARRHMVRELYIDAPNMNYFDWKFCFMDWKSLTVMKMSCGFVDEWGCLMLPSLRTLEINSRREINNWQEKQYFEPEFKGDMFSGCPNLESLVLDNYLCESFSICAPKLEYLELAASSLDRDILFLDLKLSSPNLKCVKFSNVLAAVESNSDFPHLDNVNFVIDNFPESFDQLKLSGYVLKFLQGFDNAKSLTLPLDALKALLPYGSITECLQLRNLRRLKIKAEESSNIELPISLLPCFPFLKTLVLDPRPEYRICFRSYG